MRQLGQWLRGLGHPILRQLDRLVIAPSGAGRRKLRDYGIAPPGPVDQSSGTPIRIVRKAVAVECPRCGSANTERLSAFGSTACKSLYRCVACREPFEHFKPI